MNEELDSQLSAMFDDELPSAECELLARRLSRDEQLKARWGRYAIVGAVIRAERGVRLNAPLAGRVSAVLLAEPALIGRSSAPLRVGGMRWWQPLAATGRAAGVAAVSVLWLRSQSTLPGGTPLSAQLAPAPRALPVAAVVPAAINSGSNISYVLPRAPSSAPLVVPSTELANYVVAHSMFSSPVARRNLLSAFMTSEGGTPGAEEAPQDALSAK
jgi:sigma-E factor negative regulatory protein RseA